MLFSRRQLPVFFQSEMSECGLACLAMIVNYFGLKTDLRALRKEFNVSNTGLSLNDICSLAESLNFETQALSVELTELGEVALPCIAHWDFNHFIVIKKVSSRGIIVVDPARGEIFVSMKEFSKHFTGIVLELFPSSNFRFSEDITKFSISDLWSSIVGLKRTFVSILALSVALQLLSMAGPLFLQHMLDSVVSSNSISLLVYMAIAYFLFTLAESFVDVIRKLTIAKLSNRFVLQVGSNLFNHLIRLPLDFFTKRHIGDLVSRFSSLDNIKDTLSVGIVSSIVDGFMAIVTLVIVFYYDARIGIVVVFFSALYALFRVSVFGPIRSVSEKLFTLKATEDSTFMETVRAVQMVKVFQGEQSRFQLWQMRFNSYLNQSLKMDQWSVFSEKVEKIIFVLSYLFVFVILAALLMTDSITIGVLFSVIAYKTMFEDRMKSFIDQMMEFKMIGLHLERVSDIALTKTEPQSIPNMNSQLEQQRAPSLSAVGLSFRYGDALPNVFTDISFSIPAGRSVAIVGPSGCGKSTLLKILMGLYRHQTGKLLLDGQEITSDSGFRSLISGVTQDDQLLSGSILENIAAFQTHIDEALVHECAKQAACFDEIVDFTMGFETLVGDMGSTLSGGQKQRVLLARALYRKPKILFLDEATSHLDASNERVINQNIKSMNITRVIVAHRQETIDSADEVIDLNTLQTATEWYEEKVC